MAWMEEPGPDGTITRITDRNGTLMYTRDGRTSVQIQFPESQSSVSNDYVLNGYEASFGTYEVNEEAQTITRHVEGSITRGLVGKRLTRAYRFSDGRLTMRSVRPERTLVGHVGALLMVPIGVSWHARADPPGGEASPAIQPRARADRAGDGRVGVAARLLGAGRVRAGLRPRRSWPKPRTRRRSHASPQAVMAVAFLLDTNTVSFYIRRSSAALERRLRRTPAARVGLSVVTEMELRTDSHATLACGLRLSWRSSLRVSPWCR